MQENTKNTNKAFDVKLIARVAGVLLAITAICSALIALVYVATNPIIKANEAAKETNAIVEIFADYNADKSSTVALDGKDSAIEKIIEAKDASGNSLGLLYTVSGKNDYGSIKLLVAIKDNKVIQVEFLTNDQSYSSTVESFLKSKYPSSKDSTIYIGVKPADNSYSGDGVSAEDNQDIDTACGATFGANLVKNLVAIALNDAKGGTE